MGCDFDFTIEVLVGGQWRAALTWHGRTSFFISGGLWVDAAFKAAKRAVCPAYGETGKDQPLEDEDEDEGDEGDEGDNGEEEEDGEEGAAENGKEQEETTSYDDECLFYSRAGLDTLIACADSRSDRGEDLQMLKDARVLCDLYLTCPPESVTTGEYYLSNAQAIIAAMQARQHEDTAGTDVASLPLEVVMPPVLSDIVRSFLYHGADDVRFRMHDDEGYGQTIRKAFKYKTLAEPNMDCVIS